MKRVLDKLDKIDEKQGDMGKVLARNTATLEEHVRRTNILEDKVDRVESCVDKIKGSWKLIMVISTVVGIAATIYNLL